MTVENEATNGTLTSASSMANLLQGADAVMPGYQQNMLSLEAMMYAQQLYAAQQMYCTQPTLLSAADLVGWRLTHFWLSLECAKTGNK